MIRNFRTYDLAIRFYRLCLRQPLVHPEKGQRRRANGSGQVIGSPLPDCRFLEWLTSPWDLFLEGYNPGDEAGSRCQGFVFKKCFSIVKLVVAAESAQAIQGWSSMGIEFVQSESGNPSTAGPQQTTRPSGAV